MTDVAVPPDATPRPAGSRRVRALVVLTSVLLATAAVLRLLDAVPPWLRGEPRGIRRYATVEALERETRTQLLLPFYFPEVLAWPPEAIYRAPGNGVPTLVSVSDRQDGHTRLLIAQCLEGECEFPARLLPPGATRVRESLDLADTTGERTEQVGPDGATWTDLEWRQTGRRFVVRMYGDDRELLRIARSLRRGHP